MSVTLGMDLSGGSTQLSGSDTTRTAKASGQIAVTFHNITTDQDNCPGGILDQDGTPVPPDPAKAAIVASLVGETVTGRTELEVNRRKETLRLRVEGTLGNGDPVTVNIMTGELGVVSISPDTPTDASATLAPIWVTTPAGSGSCRKAIDYSITFGS